MQVLSINSVSTSNKTNFQGTVDKSVVKYLQKACSYSSNPEEARVTANNILEKLTRFMKTLHKDTVFSVKERSVFEQIELPFDPKIAYVDSGYKLYFTEFSNKTTKSRFSVSNPKEFIVGNIQKSFASKGSFIHGFYSGDALQQFETHVNALFDYFSNSKDVDRLLFNNMRKHSGRRFSILPDFIQNYRQNRAEAKAKKIAKEFGMEPSEKQSSKFMEYKADDETANIQDAYTMSLAIL